MRLSLSIFAFAAVAAAWAQADQDPLTIEQYIEPPSPLKEAVLAPWEDMISISNIDPSGQRFIYQRGSGLYDINWVGKPHYNLGGLQIDPEAYASRSMSMRRNKAIFIGAVDTGKMTEVKLPNGFSPVSASWSPDGSQIALVAFSDEGVYLFAVDPSTARARQVTRRRMAAVRTTSVDWVNGGKSVALLLEPAMRIPTPVPNTVADSPQVRVTDAATNRIRTYADLLETPFEMRLLKHYLSGVVCVVDMASGQTKEVASGMFQSLDAAPDGRAFRVTVTEEPFSYIYPTSSFPRREYIIDANGKELYEISKRGLPDGGGDGEEVQDAPQRPGGQRGGAAGGGQRGGQDNEDREPPKRSLEWRPDGAGISYLQLGPRVDGKQKDRVMLWKYPYGEDDAEVIWESDTNISSLTYTEDCKAAFITQSIDNQTVISRVELTMGAEAKKVYSYRPGNFYDAPGQLVTKRGPLTGRVVRVSPDGKHAYLQGTKYDRNPAENAPRPFLDLLVIATGDHSDRLFFSDEDAYETVDMLDDSAERLLITRETADTPENYFLWKDGERTRLTNNVDLVPEVTNAKTRRVRITRADGFQFWATVHTPRDVMSAEGRKSIFWFYPSEVTDQAAYDRAERTYNKNSYRRPSPTQTRLLVTMGYVVVEPDCPIVGPSTAPNNTYTTQLRNNLTAVIDELERQDLIDRRLLALGGHSYGAFSTANAMIQTPYFKAGIAGDGNYNRTLTPFAFQREPRTLWDMREVYIEMSPIFWADRMTGALLMYHGQLDQNVGTFPINSERMFAALEALGKPAAMYMYPYEDHGQIARETRLDMWARWYAWLEKYVVLPEVKPTGSDDDDDDDPPVRVEPR